VAVKDTDRATVEDSGETPVGLTIEQVSRMLGVPVQTIRSWERRHQVPVVNRTPGGHRRYSSDQLDALRRMRDLVAQGLRPVDAAARVKSADATSPDLLIEALLQASQEFKPDTIREILDAAQQVLGLGRTVDDVLLPALRQIGQRWQSGEADVSHEHLATNAIRGWLSGLNQTRPPLRQFQPVVLCCGPRDDHTLGLEALGALLAERGLDCLLLGARTPAESLVRAVCDTAAAAVILVCHLTAGRQAAVDALRSADLDQTSIYYAGGAFTSHQARHGVPGHHLGDNLTSAADSIANALGSPSMSTAHEP
jgi:DNA-binding transcriptional MerR regulator/methylmalonyl-CoA mutase cobalamin-binding subunit